MTTAREQYEGWFTQNIYPLAYKYAYTNPIMGLELEDYVQDLVTMAWEKIVNYDPTKSALSTFVNHWFANVKFRYTDKIRNRGGLSLCQDYEDCDGNVCNLADTSISSDNVVAEESVRDALEKASPIAALFYQGHNLATAAKACGVSVAEASKMLKADIEIIKRAFGVGNDD